MNSAPQHFRFTADQYVRMIEAGILTKYDKCELIHGEIIAIGKTTAPDAVAVMMLTDIIYPRVWDDMLLGVRGPLRVSNDSIPQPDIALIRETYTRGTYPTARDAPLVIEVAETTQEFDREVKLSLYAAAGIPEAWLVDIANHRIERHTEPDSEGYRHCRRYFRGQSVESVAIPGLVVPVDRVLPTDDESAT